MSFRNQSSLALALWLGLPECITLRRGRTWQWYGRAGNLEAARRLHFQLLPLFKAMFIETNPIPVKTTLRLMGLLNGAPRMPLCELTAANEAKLKAVLQEYGLRLAE